MQRQKGFTMIEVLIAMLLLGSGALAMLMLQWQALRMARTDLLRSQAVMLVAELAELRGEAGPRAEADPYLFDFRASARASSAVADIGCRDQPCRPRVFADTVIADWQTRLAQVLPGGRARICRDASGLARAQWDCDDAATSPVLAKLGWPGGAPDGQPALTVFIGH